MVYLPRTQVVFVILNDGEEKACASYKLQSDKKFVRKMIRKIPAGYALDANI